MVFDSQWIKWTQVFLESLHAPVLVNDSPTNEFSTKRSSAKRSFIPISFLFW